MKSLRVPFSVARNMLILGPDRQSFLGASWVSALLGACPQRVQRSVALRLLGLSPHYFFYSEQPGHRNMSKREFLEAEFERNRASREVICDLILRPHLESDYTVLDMGCGPGFLAKHVSAHVRRVYAADISSGVLACARVLNGDDDLRYIESNEQGYSTIADGDLDLVYSFAVVQHITDDVFSALLHTAFTKLKLGGQCLFHIVLDDEVWRSEQQWIEDESLRGKVKYRYGLNCFSRKREHVVDMLSRVGFKVEEIVLASQLAPNLNDGIASQHLVRFTKPFDQ